MEEENRKDETITRFILLPKILFCVLDISKERIV